MQRIEFKPFQPDTDRNYLLLPVIVSADDRNQIRRLPLVKDVTSFHRSASTSVSEADIINTISFYLLPIQLSFKRLPIKQQHAILNDTLNLEANQQYLKPIGDQ